MTTFRVLLLTIAGATLAFPQRVGAPTDDLDKLSVDELFSIQVTSVGRKAQKLSTAPAAVFVVTAEDIRRSGATSIPEALRWVPGLTVLRQDGRTWAVSVRGSTRIFADKILVMIDGRSLYTPLFSGVIWDAIDVPLEDIEQIEVVRGPGAVMWGPNAVNGVINIITKKAQATKGVLLSAAAGNELRGAAGVRFGAAPNDDLAYRLWGKQDYRTPGYGSPGYFYFDTFSYLDPSVRKLDTATGRFGFRFDGRAGDKDQWMVQGDVFKVNRQDEAAYPALWPQVDRTHAHTDYQGGYLQARWTRTTTGGESTFQFSYDRNDITYPFVEGQLNNLTLDYQKRRQVGERNEIYWGAGYQQYWDDTTSQRFTAFAPTAYVYRAGDLVIRDEWQIAPGRLLASAGVRLDYNSYGRIEYQPSLRLLYTPNSRQSAWTAVSRAVKVPDRLDRDLLYNNGSIDLGGMPAEVLLQGSKDMRSETERGYEAGYRLQSGQRWSVDASLFFSYYSRLRAMATGLLPEVDTSGPVPSLIINTTENNSSAGRSYGGEIAATFQPRAGWRLLPSYSYTKDSRWLPDSSADLQYSWDRLPSDLRHQGLLRSQHDLARSLQLDLTARARSPDRAFHTPGALLFDARLAWRPTRSGEISFAVENLTNRHVIEVYPEIVFCAIPLRRLVVVKWTQRF